MAERLYKVEVPEISRMDFRSGVLLLHRAEAVPCVVDGVAMARLLHGGQHGAIVDAGSFHASKREAELHAADELLELSQILLRQSQQIRESYSTEDATNGDER